MLDEIDRQDFVRDAYKGLAYADCQIPVADGVRMLPPTVEGRMLQALTISKPTNGYWKSAAAADTSPPVSPASAVGSPASTRATRVIDFASANVAACGVDGMSSSSQRALGEIDDQQAWDVIAVTASLPAVPDNLRRALSIGGRMFVVVGHSPVMQALLITRVGDVEWTTQSLFETDLPRLRS